jgi:hypothetical protein
MNANVPARPLSPDEVELLKKYRDLAMPAARLAGLDDFAKWLFTSITVIGSLAAGFSTSAIKTFDTRSAIVFFVAIFLTGISLFLAVCLRAVEPQKANYQSLDDMLDKNDRALRLKQKLATWSGAAFALAVLTAGASPLASVVCRNSAPLVPNSLLYSYGKEGFKVSASFTNGARTQSEMKVSAQDASSRNPTNTLLSMQRVVSGTDGVAKLDVAVPSIPPKSTSLTIDITCDSVKKSRQTVIIKLSQTTAGAVAGDESSTGCVISVP